MRHTHAAIGLLLLLASCSPIEATAVNAIIKPTATPTVVYPPRTPTPSPTPPQHTVEPAANVVSLHLSEATTSRVFAEIDVGGTAVMELLASPSVHQITRRPDGSVESVSVRPWTDHNVAEMRMCVAPEQPCAPEGGWRPFVPESSVPLEVSWIGPKEFWVTAQFRDHNGRTVPAVGESHDEPSAVAATTYTVVGVMDDAVPIQQLPCPAQTAMAATRSAFPVLGSVQIEGGGCCAGGTAGESIEVDVNFEATSPFADVIEMRTMTGGMCFTEEAISSAGWETFEQEREFPVHVAINWVGFYVTVQYRDAEGHLSGVYCDDISIEGHPATSVP
jgi:hypothetical protein